MAKFPRIHMKVQPKSGYQMKFRELLYVHPELPADIDLSIVEV